MGCLTLTAVYQSCHSIHLFLSQTLSLSPSLFLSHYSLTLSPDRQKRSNTPSPQFPAVFFSVGSPAVNCSLAVKKRSCRRRRRQGDGASGGGGDPASSPPTRRLHLYRVIFCHCAQIISRCMLRQSAAMMGGMNSVPIG